MTRVEPAARLPLPHAYPFLLIDRVLLVEPERWAVALRGLSGDDPLLDGAGLLPPLLLVEAMAQTAGLAIGAPAGGAPLVLARVHRFRCGAPPGAGERLLVTARLIRRFGALTQVRASVRAGTRRCAAAELVLHAPAAEGRCGWER
jgi:3-hydroxyacyl-[acyl-carrier-protein] dehydratase